MHFVSVLPVRLDSGHVGIGDDEFQLERRPGSPAVQVGGDQRQVDALAFFQFVFGLPAEKNVQRRVDVQLAESARGDARQPHQHGQGPAGPDERVECTPAPLIQSTSRQAKPRTKVTERRRT